MGCLQSKINDQKLDDDDNTIQSQWKAEDDMLKNDQPSARRAEEAKKKNLDDNTSAFLQSKMNDRSSAESAKGAKKKLDDDHDDDGNSALQSQSKAEDDMLIETLSRKKFTEHVDATVRWSTGSEVDDSEDDLVMEECSESVKLVWDPVYWSTGTEEDDYDDDHKYHLISPRPAYQLLHYLGWMEKKLMEYHRNMKYDKKYDLIVFDRYLENFEAYARIGVMECESSLRAYRNGDSKDADQAEEVSKIIQDITKDKMTFGIADMKAKSLQLIIHEVIDPTLASNPKHTTATNESKKQWLTSTRRVNSQKPESMSEDREFVYLNESPPQRNPFQWFDVHR